MKTANRKLKIAQIAPVIERVPPKKYGGTERIVHALTENLVKKGHKVTLYATGDSLTSAKLISVLPKGLRELKITNELNPNYLLHIGLAFEQAKNYDIIHDHTGFLSLPAANLSPTPTIVTMHGPFTTQNRKIYQTLKRPHLVAISKSQMQAEKNANWAGMIYNGLPMEHYPFGNEHEDYLLFVGRISMEKGVHHAIEIAQYLNYPLIIAAKLDVVDKDYFREYIEPHLSEQIRWIGEVDEKERNILMSKALCLINPITWREPFGLTMIEAMACGCPVVTFARGSANEIVVNGKTGFVVNDLEEMIDAVINIKKIERINCRNHALEEFGDVKMTESYEALYRKILAENKKKNIKKQK